jgi:hypothetical protein
VSFWHSAFSFADCFGLRTKNYELVTQRTQQTNLIPIILNPFPVTYYFSRITHHLLTSLAKAWNSDEKEKHYLCRVVEDAAGVLVTQGKLLDDLHTKMYTNVQKRE